MKVIGRKRDVSASHNISEQHGKEAECRGGDDLKIVEVLVTERTDEKFVKNGTGINSRVLNISDYHRTDLLAGFELIDDSDTLLHDVVLPHVTSPRASFRMYGFDYLGGTLSVILHSGMSADDVTAPRPGAMTAGRQILNNGRKLLLLDGRRRLAALHQLVVKSDVSWIQ